MKKYTFHYNAWITSLHELSYDVYAESEKEARDQYYKMTMYCDYENVELVSVSEE